MQQCTELNVTNRPRAYPERGGRVKRTRRPEREEASEDTDGMSEREKVSVFGFEGTPSEKQQSITEEK